MPRKPIELPPAVARRFVEDMRAFHAEKNSIKRDEIAARQRHALAQHYSAMPLNVAEKAERPRRIKGVAEFLGLRGAWLDRLA